MCRHELTTRRLYASYGKALRQVVASRLSAKLKHTARIESHNGTIIPQFQDFNWMRFILHHMYNKKQPFLSHANPAAIATSHKKPLPPDISQVAWSLQSHETPFPDMPDVSKLLKFLKLLSRKSLTVTPIISPHVSCILLVL